MKRIFFLNGTLIKIIALISMTFDHIGVFIFPNMEAFRIIGRLAFPIFAYMIAEGVKYTHNRLKYFLIIFLMSIIYSVGYYFIFKEIYLTVFTSFSVGILLSYSCDCFRNSIKENLTKALLGLLFTLLLFALAYLIGFSLNEIDGYHLEYGFYGILLIPFIYLAFNKPAKIFISAILLAGIALTASLGEIQWYGFLALIPLALYNGKPGKYRMKYLFYFYYPLHIGLIYLISTWI